ncbi:methyltransferase domain-containing protein [Methanocalculus sp. MC3]
MVENITQEICDQYLRCPSCHAEGKLYIESKEVMICNSCLTRYPIAHDIPALMISSEIHQKSYGFLGWENNDDTIGVNPYEKQRFFPFWLEALFFGILSEILYFFVGLLLWVRAPLTLFEKSGKWTRGVHYCSEMKEALYYGWTNYFNLILKSGEIVAFNRMKSYINEPSMEIGCGNCMTTNMIFRDSLNVTFGCEYFMDGYLDSPEDLYKVIKHYVGGSIKSLPFSSNVFESIYMVHIIDHIHLLDNWFHEINRIIKPGGYLVIDTYSKYVFDQLPGVRWRSKISKSWAIKYKNSRICRLNPYRYWIPLKTDDEFYATGQNMFSIDEWSVIVEKYGFKMIDYYPFTNKLFSFFMDLEYRGYYPSITGSIPIYLAIDEEINRGKNSLITEEEAGNIIMVFQKV